MKFIEVAGKKLKLASRFARLSAFFIDGILIAGVLSILVFLFDAMGSGIGPSLIRIGLLSTLLWTLGPKTNIDEDTFPLVQMSIIGLFGPWLNYGLDTLLWGSAAIGAAVLFFIDGFSDGQSPGKKLLSLQVLRLKNGKPCSFKDSFVRRLTSIFQPLDSFWTFGKHRQKATVVAQHRNIDAEVHLREMLKEIQNNPAFETLANLEKKATEAATLAKAAAETDVAYQNAALAREFSGYAEDASIDKDLTELKTKL